MCSLIHIQFHNLYTTNIALVPPTEIPMSSFSSPASRTIQVTFVLSIFS